MKAISTASAPPAGGHYSQAIVHAGLVYVAGQLPIVPGEAAPGLRGRAQRAREGLEELRDEIGLPRGMGEARGHPSRQGDGAYIKLAERLTRA